MYILTRRRNVNEPTLRGIPNEDYTCLSLDDHDRYAICIILTGPRRGAQGSDLFGFGFRLLCSRDVPALICLFSIDYQPTVMARMLKYRS